MSQLRGRLRRRFHQALQSRLCDASPALSDTFGESFTARWKRLRRYSHFFPSSFADRCVHSFSLDGELRSQMAT